MKKQCSVDGCERSHRSLGLCNMHYRRLREKGDVGEAETLKPGTVGTCAATDCDQPCRSSGSPHCEKHYYRLRRNGSLTAKRSWHRRGTCSVEGCTAPERELGMCMTHAARMKRHGDPAFTVPARYGPDHQGWVGDAVSYEGAHGRVKAIKGSASAYACTDCGNPADQWSYDHADPAERVGSKGRYFNIPYSANPDHYLPQCYSCHKRFDLAAKRGAA